MPKRVVFVCVENRNRSQMAQAFARIHGGPDVEAHSAESRPSGRVNPKAIAAMAELGYDLSAHTSSGSTGRSLTPREMPPEEFRQVRDLIGEKVKALLATL